MAGFFIIFAPMKLRCFIGAILFLAMAACHHPVETLCTPSLPELVAIDSLMQNHPDSALALLQASPKNDPYYQLLLSEAFYKNDSAQLNRPMLLEALAYYDSLDWPFLSARCHYMNGVGYYEMDSVVEACEEYLKALEIMEEHYNEKDFVGYKAKFMALIYTHLTVLFSDQYLHEQAIYFGKQSLVYYYKHDAEPWHLAWMLDEIGSYYNMMEQFDSAACYYSKAVDCSIDTTNSIYRDIVARQAILSYERTPQSNHPIAVLRHLIETATNIDELLSRCLVLGDIYYYESNYDSSWYYLNYVYDNTNRIDSKILAADRLYKMALTKGDTLKANEFAQTNAKYVIIKDEEGNLHSKLTALWQRYVKENHDIQQGLRIKKAKKQWFIVVGSLITVAVLVFFLYQRNHKRHLERIVEEKQKAHRTFQAALSSKLKKSNQELRELKDKIKQQDGTNIEHREQADCFQDEPICKLISQRVKEGQFKSQMKCSVYKDYALNREQLLALRDAADHHFNLFTIRLKQAYPKLSNGDLTYCCLYLLGLSDADISALTQKEYPTVSEHSRKIKRILGDKTLVTTLRNFSYSSDL